MSRKPKSARLTASELKRQIPDVVRVASDLYGVEFRNGVARCPFTNKHNHGDRDPSLRYDRKKNRVFCASQKCFGEKGADAIGLVQMMDDCRFPEAIRKVADHYGISTVASGAPSPRPPAATRSAGPEERPQKEMPILADHARQRLQRQGYSAVTEFEYGSDLRKIRFEHETQQQEDKKRAEKTYRWEHRVGRVWYSGDGGLFKPLYANNVFRERDQVGLVVGFEGEAKADVAGEFGFAAFSFKDMTPEQAGTLVASDVVLWPDNDESGAEQARTAADIIATAGEVRSIKLVTPPSDLPSAGDIVDAVHGLRWDRTRISQLLRTARDYQTAPSPDLPESGGGAESQEGDELTQSQILIELARVATLFHTPEGDAYACLPVREHREVWLVKSKSCRRWFTRAFYERVGKPPSSQAMQDALGVVEAKAQFDSAETQVFTRVAACGDCICIDLCNDAWEAVEISGNGWRVVQDPPVRFRRSKAMQPLPHPVPGMPISRLRNLINVGDDRNWILLLSWLGAACRPQGPYPVLILQGEQGSAKSTTARLLRKIIDPVTAPLRTPPREERDLLIAANNSWVVAYDNISDIPQWLSDALCRLATAQTDPERRRWVKNLSIKDEPFDAAMQRVLVPVGLRYEIERNQVVLYRVRIPIAREPPSAR